MPDQRSSLTLQCRAKFTDGKAGIVRDVDIGGKAEGEKEAQMASIKTGKSIEEAVGDR